MLPLPVDAVATNDVAATCDVLTSLNFIIGLITLFFVSTDDYLFIMALWDDLSSCVHADKKCNPFFIGVVCMPLLAFLGRCN